MAPIDGSYQQIFEVPLKNKNLNSFLFQLPLHPKYHRLMYFYQIRSVQYILYLYHLKTVTIYTTFHKEQLKRRLRLDRAYLCVQIFFVYIFFEANLQHHGLSYHTVYQ